MNRDNIEDIYQLSPVQQGILFHSLYSPDLGVYFVQQCYTLRGNLNSVAFEDAWQQIVSRHTTLRTSFYWENLDKPVQVVHRQVKVPLKQYDWRGVNIACQQERLEAFLESNRKQGFDLSNGPLIRLTLIRLADESYRFVWSKHHLILDGWSTALVLKEVVQRYEALCQGQSLPDAPGKPYGDYIAWLQQQDLSKAEVFWRQVLSGKQAPTPLIGPNAENSSGLESDHGKQQLKLSLLTTAALQFLARQHQLTLSTFIQGAWAILLSRYSREEDVIYGSTVSGRPADLARAESMVGLFINTLPVRVKVNADTALLPWLEQLQAHLVEMRQYEYSPLVEIQGWSEVPRGVPLFESILVFENYPVDRVLWESKVNIEIQNVTAFDRTNYPLTAIAIPGSELEFKISYDCNRFDCATITRMLGHLQTLLEGMATNPNSLLKDLPLLAKAEEHQLLVEWNDTGTQESGVVGAGLGNNFHNQSITLVQNSPVQESGEILNSPQNRCIHQLFEEQVERTPDAVAVAFEDEQLTYRELNEQANKIAHYLRRLRVEPEVLVGICMKRSPLMLVGLLGILKAGGAYLPLDPALPCDRSCFMLEDAKVSVLLTESKLVASLPEYQGRVICLDVDWEELARESHCNPTNKATPENLAYAIYTSGSTGQPKGVAILHDALFNFLSAMRLTPGLWQAGILLSATTLSFDIAALELYLPLIVGARLVLVSRDVAADGTQLLERLIGSGATVMQATPATWRLLLTAGWQGCERLKILCGGEALDACLASELLERGSEVWNLYGPTETTIWSAAHKVEVCKNSDRENSIIPIGRPIANTQFYVLNPQGQPVPVGIAGELYIGGAGVARGYLNRAELTAEKFIPNPFSKSIQNYYSQRLYKTGDLVRYRADGNLEYLGRIDYQVKVRGFRIELGEIEFVLSQHPAVQETVVLAQEDAQGDKRLVAYVVTQQQPALSDLRRFLIEKLPEYMVPSIFVPLVALPLTPNGKVDRRSLKVPDLTQLQPEVPFVAPCTPIEEMLAGIWAEVLGIEKIGIHDNFFELGGHSLLATRVISQLRKVLEVELPLRRLFEQPTVAELAKDIETATKAGLGPESPSIKPIARDTELPLSFAQQRLWFLAQLEPHGLFYNIPGTFHVQGQFNINALEQSLNEVLRRHEALRTAFKTVEGRPVSVISSVTPLFLPVIDLSELPKHQQQARVRQLAHREAQQPFALDTSPLLRVKLLRLAEKEHVVLFTMHHIVSDGWSMGILVREISALYQAFCSGQSSPLPELPIQYADFAAWQRQWLQGEVLETQLSYWRQQLRGAPAVLELPIDHPRRAIRTFQGATYSFQLSQELSVVLKSLSQQEDSTLFMTLLAAFKTLLYRYTGREDIVVGSPIANRNRAEIEGLIGFFVNTLVLRTNLAGDPSFKELLERVREVALGAYAHQDLPFELLVEELQPRRDLSHPPLFQVMFVLQNAPMSALELSGLTLSPVESDSSAAKFDLTLNLAETEEGLVGSLEYNTDLFRESSIRRMVGHWQTLLSGIVAHPQQRLSELPLLTELEQYQLLKEWNDTEVEYPQQHCIHQLFEEQVECTPDAVAVVFEDEQLTYGELNIRANQLAHYLQKLGVKPEVLVGICVERSIEMVIGLLSILKAGGAYVPLDPGYPQERIVLVLQDARVKVLLTQQHLIENLLKHQTGVVCLDTDWEAIAQEIPQNPINDCKADNLAYVIYTSGSTGQPKGVLVNHSNVARLLAATQSWYKFSRYDIWTLFHSIAFDFSVWEIWGALLAGGRLVIIPHWLSRSPQDFYELLLTQQITILNQTPSAFRQLIQAEELSRTTNKPNLRLVIFGGEALQLENLKPWFERHGDQLPQLVNMYGITETAVHVTYRPLTTADLKAASGSVIGYPIPDLQVYLLDQYLQPVPIGVLGEVHVGGDGTARGYLNRPELTAQKFIPNPFSSKPNARLYRSGDLARYLPNGEIEYLGRLDYQVKIRGFRIELGEIESVLSQHSTVSEAVVVARTSDQGDQQLVAYAVPHPKTTLSAPELRLFLRDKLPEYMMPAAFVILEALPLTPNGKVDRKALQDPTLTQTLSSSQIIAPSTPIETLLAGIWAEVLGTHTVGIDHNFFDLGGHSLIATRVISQIRQVFQVELPLRYLFEKPTIAELAKEIEKAIKIGLGVEPTRIERISRSQELPLSFAQQRLWFLSQLEPNSSIYNIPAAVRLQGTLNLTALQQSFNEIISRHEALRTNFSTREGQAIAAISEVKPLPLSVLDISELSSHQQEVEVRQQAIAEAQRPFDLKGDLLLRVKLLGLNEQEHILFLTMHHIASDGWSIGVLVRELAALYQFFCGGQPSLLPELPIQYVDFAAWQRQWLQGEVLQAQIAYWRQKLEGAPAILELPTDHPRPALQTFRGATLTFKLSQELSVALKKLSQQENSTLFMTLLAAFKTLLCRYIGSEDILVGSPIANRNHSEIEKLIGFFVNTLVLRTNLSNDPTFRELLRQVREATLGAYAHQDLPFEQLVETLQPQRSLSHTPLFQVMFVLQNAPTSEIELPGLTLSFIENNTGTAKFDLTLSMQETGNGLMSGTFEYNTDLFEAATIARMTAHWQVLLSGVVANPDQRLSELPLLTEPEQHQLLLKWNETFVQYPQQKCIHQLFEEQVERTPDAIAMVFEDQQLTYWELNARANRIAHYLQRLGVGPEVLVSICVERSLEMVTGLLGILKAGGAYVPLDPAYPRERLDFILQDTRVSVLLTQQKLVVGLSEHQAKVVCLDTSWEEIAKASERNPTNEATVENLAYVIYTSGSTGQPKGVAILHSALVNFLSAMRLAPGLSEEDILLSVTTLSFDIVALELYLPLIVGARLVVVTREVTADGTQLLEQLDSCGATLMQATPATWRLLLAAGWQSHRPLKILCGGEALDYSLVNQLLKRGTELWNLYGPTETTIWSAVHKVEPQNSAASQNGFVSVGQPIANTQFYILDQYMQPVPVGVSGELHIGGVGLARGYLNRPAFNAQKFIPNPFNSNPISRLYKTGDLARYLPDGNIEFLGRIDNQVKVRGFRIELGEIESVVSQYPRVREAVVAAREDAQGSKRLVAYTVFESEQTPTITELRRFLEEKLPSYMVPSAFVPLEALPLTPNGKVDRKALPASEALRPQLDITYVMPRTEAEQVIVKVWQKALEIEKIGIHDNFFELGGHSLLLVQVNSQLRELFNIDLSLIEMFRYPTVSALADYFSQARNQQSSLLNFEEDIQTEKAKAAKVQQQKRRQKMQSKQ